MKLSTVILGMSIFLMPLLAGCGERAERLEGRLGNETVVNLQQAQEVLVVGVEPGATLLTPKFLAEKRALTQVEAEQLRRLLMSDSSYIFDRTKSCLFIPEYAFLFMSGEKVVLTVLYSPSCKQVRFISGERGVVLDIDPAFNSLQEVINQFKK